MSQCIQAALHQCQAAAQAAARGAAAEAAEAVAQAAAQAAAQGPLHPLFGNQHLFGGLPGQGLMFGGAADLSPFAAGHSLGWEAGTSA